MITLDQAKEFAVDYAAKLTKLVQCGYFSTSERANRMTGAIIAISEIFQVDLEKLNEELLARINASELQS